MIERLEIDSASIDIIDLQTISAAHMIGRWVPRADDAPNDLYYAEVVQTHIAHFEEFWGYDDETTPFEALYEGLKMYEIKPPDRNGIVMHCIAKTRFKKWTTMFDIIYKPGTKQAGWGESIEANL